MVSFDHPVFGGNGATFYQRQQVTLNAFTRNIRTGRLAALTDFVDFVDKHDPVLLNSVDSVLLQLFRVHQFRRFFFNQQLHGVFDFQLTRFLLLAAQVLEHGLQLAGHLFHARRSHNFNAHRCCGKIDLDFFVIKLAFTQFFAECLTSSGRFLLLFGLSPVVFSRWDQHVENTFFCQFFSAITVFLDSLDAYHFHGGIGQIANNRIHFLTDVAHFGEFGRFNFDERRIRQLSQTTGDFSFTDTGRADHQDIFRGHFMAQLFVELHATPAVTQSNRHRTLGVVLADDVLIQFADDFAWGHFRHGRSLRFVA